MFEYYMWVAMSRDVMLSGRSIIPPTMLSSERIDSDEWLRPNFLFDYSWFIEKDVRVNHLLIGISVNYALNGAEDNDDVRQQNERVKEDSLAGN